MYKCGRPGALPPPPPGVLSTRQEFDSHLDGQKDRTTSRCWREHHSERSCPPEDIGGVYGYAGFLEAIADPSHEDRERYLEWVGGDFDPEEFDADKVNIYLKNLSGRWRAPRGRR